MNRSLKKPSIAVLVAAVIAVVVYIFFPAGGLAQCETSGTAGEQVNQEWTEEERQWFYHTSQGSQLMPYKWFISLEQPDHDYPFIDADYLALFLVIPDVKSEYNPDSLPVGFAKDPGAPNPSWGEQVGITCAACHTGQINYKGKSLRIDGAPGQLNVNGFLTSLGKAMLATVRNRNKFDRFAERVLGEDYNKRNKSQLKKQVQKYIDEQLEGILEQLTANAEAFMKLKGQPTTPGFGRIDALGQGGNVLFGKLRSPGNLRVLNAPVDILPLWNASTYGWVQTNSSIRQPMARNIIEALAVNSYLELPKKKGDRKEGYVSSVRMKESWCMEEMAARLKAPQWPKELFGEDGKIDEGKVKRGKVLYQELCAKCHAPQLETPTSGSDEPVLPPGYPPDPVSQRLGKRFYYLRISDLDEIGTDPMDAKNFANRHANARKIGLKRKTWGPEIIYPVIAGIMKRYYTDHKIPPDTQVEWNGYRGNYWRAPEAYPARPLAGIWATAPFLHNGSVPNLYELLLPAKDRSKTFYRGNREFDPVHVGFVADHPFEGSFEFNTRVTGNHNTGHELRKGAGKGVIGRELEDEERWQIIEYLKVLRFEDEVPPEGSPGNESRL